MHSAKSPAALEKALMTSTVMVADFASWISSRSTSTGRSLMVIARRRRTISVGAVSAHPSSSQLLHT